MNFYPHFLGDYARDTAHLSILEHGAYRLMLDHCYATEKPLPAEKASLYRICKALTAAERKAVDSIADQFFKVNGDGSRHNVRADAELAKAREYANAQSMRAHKRWDKQVDMPAHVPEPSRSDANHNHNQIKSKPAEPDGSLDPIWGPGLQILKSAGVPENHGRSFLGALLGSWESADVLEALQAASGKGDPRSYVRGVLRKKPKKGEAQKLKVAL